MSDGLFSYSWLEAGRRDAPEIEHTLAELRITIDGHCVTRVYASRSGSERESLYTSLYPLAEWMVANWWSIFAEVPNDLQIGSPEVSARHSLRSVGDGFLFPDLEFWWNERQIRANWRTCLASSEPTRFLAFGSADLEALAVRDSFAALIQGVVDRLATRGIQGSWLQVNWPILQQSLLDAEEREFCEAAGCLGQDPYSLTDETADQLMDFFQSTPRRLAFDLLQSVRYDEIAAGMNWLEHCYAHKSASHTAPAWLDTLRGTTDSDKWQATDQPWEWGYQLARSCHNSWPQTWAPDRNPLEELLAQATVAEPSDQWPQGVSALSVADDQGGMHCLLRAGRLSSQRFTLARALYHQVTLKTPVSRLVTHARTWDQRASRAFAAELLAPSHLLREQLVGVRSLSAEDLADLAANFNVSEFVIRDQLRNHDLMPLPEY